MLWLCTHSLQSGCEGEEVEKWGEGEQEREEEWKGGRGVRRESKEEGKRRGKYIRRLIKLNDR